MIDLPTILNNYNPSTSTGALNRRQLLAQQLVQQGAQASNPFINLLASAVGSYQLADTARQEEALGKQEAELKKALLLNEEAWKQKDFGIKEQQLAQSGALNAAQLAKANFELQTLKERQKAIQEFLNPKPNNEAIAQQLTEQAKNMPAGVYDVSAAFKSNGLTPEEAAYARAYPEEFLKTRFETSQAFQKEFNKESAKRAAQGQTPNLKDIKESEAKAAGFFDRMQNAEAIIQQVGDVGNPNLRTEIAANTPLIGGVLAERIAQSPEQQSVRQAQEDWVRSKLRKESGAVIGEEEMAREISTYFPQLGDSKKVIEQKAKARQTAIKAMKNEGTRAIKAYGIEEVPVGEIKFLGFE